MRLARSLLLLTPLLIAGLMAPLGRSLGQSVKTNGSGEFVLGPARV